ncbi:unnamed protein product [Auanema sp. JU1783]|nr:unnamed protein product [Auanema sp. JU1783]
MGLVRDLGAYTPSLPFRGKASRIWTITWNFDGLLLASGGDDKTVRIWKHIPDAEKKLENMTTIDDGHNKAVRTLAFSHCGKFLMSGSFDASMIVYAKEDGEFTETNTLEGHESEVKCVAYNASDEFLASCSRDKTVWFWQLDEDDDYQVVSVLQAHTQDVKFVVWHPTENLLVSCSYDSSIRFYVYDDEDWVTQQKLENIHDGTVWCADFDGSGDRLVTVGEDRIVQIFKREYSNDQVVKDSWKVACKHEISNSRWPLYSVSWNKATNLIAVAGGDATIRIFSYHETGDDIQLTEEHVIEKHTGEVNCVSWNPIFVNLLASCSDDGTIRLTEVEI